MKYYKTLISKGFLNREIRKTLPNNHTFKCRNKAIQRLPADNPKRPYFPRLIDIKYAFSDLS